MLNKELLINLENKDYSILSHELINGNESISGELYLYNNVIHFKRIIECNEIIEYTHDISGSKIINIYTLSGELKKKTIQYASSSEEFLYENNKLACHLKYSKTGQLKIIERFEENKTIVHDYIKNIKTIERKINEDKTVIEIFNLQNVEKDRLCIIYKFKDTLEYKYSDGRRREIYKLDGSNITKNYDYHNNLISKITTTESEFITKTYIEKDSGNILIEKDNYTNIVTITKEDYKCEIIHPEYTSSKSVIIRKETFYDDKEIKEIKFYKYVCNGKHFKLFEKINIKDGNTTKLDFKYEDGKKIITESNNFNSCKRVIEYKNNEIENEYIIEAL